MWHYCELVPVSTKAEVGKTSKMQHCCPLLSVYASHIQKCCVFAHWNHYRGCSCSCSSSKLTSARCSLVDTGAERCICWLEDRSAPGMHGAFTSRSVVHCWDGCSGKKKKWRKKKKLANVTTKAFQLNCAALFNYVFVLHAKHCAQEGNFHPKFLQWKKQNKRHNQLA